MEEVTICSGARVHIKFLHEVAQGIFSEVVPANAGAARVEEAAVFIDTEEREFYYSFDC